MQRKIEAVLNESVGPVSVAKSSVGEWEDIA